jgi:hypothetical protein
MQFLHRHRTGQASRGVVMNIVPLRYCDVTCPSGQNFQLAASADRPAPGASASAHPYKQP